MVYVQNKQGNPLMPTTRYAKVRLLLKQKQAVVVKARPFTIRLLYESTEYVQPATLGIDSGYTYIGFSAVNETKELISGEATLLSDMSKRLSERRMYRNQRRTRRRYRAPRFDNRRRSENWLAPSIQHKLDSHTKVVGMARSLVPIKRIVVEVASFDVQKIKTPDIEGVQYQQGEQKDSYNAREYVLCRDGYTCQHCGETKLPLQTHHIGYWKGDKSNRPGSLITLCIKCHVPKNHEVDGFLYGWEPKLKSFRDATFMSTVRWRLVNILNCEHTYGFVTKAKRIDLGLPKSHCNDAFCIAGGENQIRAVPIQVSQYRRNNRSQEKFYDAKYIDSRTGKKVSGQELFNGRRTRNKNNNSENLHQYRKQKVSDGRRSIRKHHYFYQPNDLVRYSTGVVAVKGTHNKGTRVILKTKPKEVSVKVSELQPYRFSKGLVVA